MSTKKGMKLNKTIRGGPRTFSTPEEMSKDVYAMNARRTNDSSDEDEGQGRVRHANPAQAVMEIRNPNSGGQLMPEQSDSEEEDEDQELQSEPANRKEREARQKEQARERHLQLTAEGKTDQARADLARLAIIRKQREDAKKKKEEAAVESLAKKNESLAAGKSLIGKTLGKK